MGQHMAYGRWGANTKYLNFGLIAKAKSLKHWNIGDGEEKYNNGGYTA